MISRRIIKSGIPQGRIDNISNIDFEKDGKHTVSVTGQLSIHGETKTITTLGTITIQSGTTTANADFNISLTDYKINIPSLAKDKISNSVKIVVSLQYEKPA